MIPPLYLAVASTDQTARCNPAFFILSRDLVCSLRVSNSNRAGDLVRVSGSVFAVGAQHVGQRRLGLDDEADWTGDEINERPPLTGTPYV